MQDDEYMYKVCTLELCSVLEDRSHWKHHLPDSNCWEGREAVCVVFGQDLRYDLIGIQTEKPQITDNKITEFVEMY